MDNARYMIGYYFFRMSLPTSMRALRKSSPTPGYSLAEAIYHYHDDDHDDDFEEEDDDNDDDEVELNLPQCLVPAQQCLEISSDQLLLDSHVS